MAWKQTLSFNQAAAGKVYGYCLRNVRLGYGIASRYATAKDAWNNTQQHRDRNVPKGIAVPLFYTYRTAGHINVQLPDGRVWSDGAIYASIASYEAQKEPVFIGWGESVNGVSVIQWKADPVPAPPTSKMPPVGSKVKLLPNQTRTTFRAGTTTVAGSIKVTDNTYIYTVRGYDPKYPGRILINSRTGGGDGIALALFYVTGSLIEGWVKV